jgi:hypothetical protein
MKKSIPFVYLSFELFFKLSDSFPVDGEGKEEVNLSLCLAKHYAIFFSFFLSLLAINYYKL